jgi:soluble lytic murein transglycosylase-like protein
MHDGGLIGILWRNAPTVTMPSTTFSKPREVVIYTNEATTTPTQAPAVTKRVHSAERQSSEKQYAYNINNPSITANPVKGKPLTRGPPLAFVSAHDATIRQLALSHNLPPELIYAVIATESGFNPHAQTSALGLMQIKESTARSVGFTGARSRLLDASVNLQYGTAYLAKAYRLAKGNPCRAVSLYNRGLGNSRVNSTYCARVADHIARYRHVDSQVATQDANSHVASQTTASSVDAPVS